MTLPIQQFHTSLHQWYQQHGRHDLPWRHTDDAYAILVSEIMLQQTQVQTVLDKYYHPFLRTFPTLTDLANAPLEAVMKQWQGLGYYRRAKYLHAIAKQPAPILPDNVEALMQLPGIGKNTAHALMAFAYHQPYPVMEANVKRLLCRIFALTKPSEKTLWQHAFELLDTNNPFDYNQAMMDVGALLCTPKSPNCTQCPANQLCKGKKSPERYPATTNKRQTPIRTQNILVVKDTQDMVYATARTGEFLHGLYQFVELNPEEQTIQLNGTYYPKTSWQYVGMVKQTYSHFKQHADIYTLTYQGNHQTKNWHTRDILNTLPLSKKEQKILVLLRAGS